MKKLLIIFMLMCIIALPSCGDVSDIDVQMPSNVDVDTGASDAVSGDDSSVSASDSTIEETVLVDESGIKITAKELESGWLGTDLKLLIENNTDKNITVQTRNSSVNGYMVETMMSVDVAAGKKANDSLTFSGLDECGIDAIADMEFSFYVFDSDTWEAYYESSIIKLNTSIADTYEYKYDDAGAPVYEGNGVKIVAKGTEEDSIFGPSIVLYIYNSGEKPVTVQTRDVSVNGFMVSAICSQEIMPGKHAITDITFLSSDLDENDIVAIEDVELSFHIFNTETWDTIADTETVSLTFSN